MTFALFNLFDETGELAIKCFVSKYSEYGDSSEAKLLSKSLAKFLPMDGQATLKATQKANDISASTKSKRCSETRTNESSQMRFSVCGLGFKNLDAIKKYRSANGYELIYTDVVDLTLRRTGLRVSKDILTANLPGLTFSVSSIK